MDTNQKIDLAGNVAAYAAAVTIGMVVRSAIPVPTPVIERVVYSVGTAAITATLYGPVKKAAIRELRYIFA
jgi:purine-cytosine permease-like protein